MRTAALLWMFPLLLAPGARAQWTPVPDPAPFQGIESFLPGESALYAGTFTGKVFASTDRGNAWSEIAGGPEEEYAPVQAMAVVGDWFVMSRAGFEERNFRSHRDGSTWQPWEALAYQDDNIRSLTVIGETLFAILGNGGVHRSDDHAATWTPVATPGTAGTLFAHAGRLFIADHQINEGTFHRSDDLGASWVEAGTGPTSSFVCSHAYWQGQLLVCVYHMGGVGSLWASPDFGDTWQEVTTLPSQRNLNGMAITYDNRLAVGASGATQEQESIWISGDLVGWEDYTGNLPAPSFNELVSFDGYFFKTGGSVTEYRAPHPPVTAAIESPASGLSLSARPNPFRPGTTLHFALDATSRVDLAIFDVTGRRVATIASGAVSAGGRDFRWDGRDDAGRPVTAGVYLARLRTDHGTQERKLVLVR